MLFTLCGNSGYICIDFTTNMTTGHWTYSLEEARYLIHDPSSIKSWPIRKCLISEQLEYLATIYTLLEIDNIPVSEFKQLNPEYFI